MATVTVMVGLQGSGKSTIAKQIQEKKGQENCVIVSSDAIRKEYNNQITNDKVFKLYYARAKNLLQSGIDVVLDATNITMKSRRQIFEYLKGVECRKECYIVNTPVNICAKRLLDRNQDTSNQVEVPLDVLYKYEKSFEIPFYEEGWDYIAVHKDSDFCRTEFDKAINVMNDFDQKNTHHKYSLGKHCKTLEKLLKGKGFPKNTGLFHDIGKMFTQTFGEDGQAHYYQHHCVGAYFLLSHMYLLDNEDDKFDLLFFVNYHMMPFNWQSEKAMEKWKERFGEKKFEMLKILNEGDREASGTQ